MQAALIVVVFAAPPADTPARLSDRWLLKLAPENLPELPNSFWSNTWRKDQSERSGGRWTEWISFTPGNDKRAGEAAIALASNKIREVTGRTAPLAVHGPVIEFDRKLYTVAVTKRRTDAGNTVQYLTLGAAVEVKPNLWYQAYSEDFSDGTTRVTEIRAEFATDPRRKKEGKAKVQLNVRMLVTREGERIEYDGEFLPAKGQFGPAVRIWGKLNATAAKNVWLELPYGETAPRFDTAPSKRLTATADTPPKPTKPAASPDLVQPPPGKP